MTEAGIDKLTIQAVLDEQYRMLDTPCEITARLQISGLSGDAVRVDMQRAMQVVHTVADKKGMQSTKCAVAGMGEELLEGALQHSDADLHKDILLEQFARECLDQLPNNLNWPSSSNSSKPPRNHHFADVQKWTGEDIDTKSDVQKRLSEIWDSCCPVNVT